MRLNCYKTKFMKVFVFQRSKDISLTLSSLEKLLYFLSLQNIKNVSILEAFVEDDDAPPQPDIGKAKNHLKLTSPLDEKGRWRGVWSTSMAELNEIGGFMHVFVHPMVQ